MNSSETQVITVGEDYRLLLPHGWRPGPETIERLVARADPDRLGVVNAVLTDDDGGEVVAARFERVRAVEAARRLAGGGADLDDVIDEHFGIWWVAGYEYGFVRSEDSEDKGA